MEQAYVLCREHPGGREIGTATRHHNLVNNNHRSADRVRAHIFLCMLAWHVKWHMRETWRPLLFADTELGDGIRTRDLVAPARRSESAERKASGAVLEDGTPAHCFRTLMEMLGTMTRNTCRVRSPEEGTPAAEFEITAQADERQRRALDLLKGIAVLSMPAPRL